MASTATQGQGATETAVSPVALIADPAPLGLAAFATTTFVLSVFNAGLMNPKLVEVVLPLALFYGGLSQFMAGMWEFRNRNTFGATAFTSYGAFWLAFVGYVKYIAGSLPADVAYQATGIFLLAWTIFTGYMFIASFRTSGAVMAVFATLFATFVLLTAGTLLQMPAVGQLGGYVGILTALLAWYASFAAVTNATWKRSVLPVGPRA